MDDLNQHDTIETGHVRVVLLVLAVFLFSWVWQNDHPPKPPEQRIAVSFQIELPRTSRSSDSLWANESIEGTLESCWHLSPWTPAKQDLVEAALIPVVAERPAQIEEQPFSFSLPKAIVPGEYRIIDQQGEVSHLTMTLEMMLAHGLRFGSSNADSFLSRQGDNRWHFIRLEEEITAPTTNDIVVDRQVKEVWHGLFAVLDRQIEQPLRTLNRPLKNWLSPHIEVAKGEQLLK